MTLLAIDPGASGCGAALFQDGVLKWCAYPVHADYKPRGGAGIWYGTALATLRAVTDADLPRASRIACEIPQVYRTAQSKGDPNDLVPLAFVEGVIVGLLRPDEVVSYTPREWKGQVPKNIHNQRVLSALSSEEMQVVGNCGVSPRLLHNAIDAIGVGLYDLKKTRDRG